MIHSLHIGNFKAFGDMQEVLIRPLTLIYGPNSAGKSSIIHSLALAHHALMTGDLDVHRMEIGGESIDLGGFRQYVHRRDASRRVEWTLELNTTKLEGRIGEILTPANRVALQFLIGEIGRDGVGVVACSLLADGAPLMVMSAREGGRFRIDRLDQTHPVFRQVIKAIVLSATTTDRVREEDFQWMDEAIDALIPELSVRLHGLLLALDADFSPEQGATPPLFPVSRGERKRDLAQAVKFFLPRTVQDLLGGVSSAVGREVGRLRYLGPLRSYPPRHLAFAGHHDPNWHAGGGYAWDVLRRNSEVRDAVNRWLLSQERLSTPYEVVVRGLLAFDQLDGPLRDAIEAIQENGGLDIEPDYDDEPVPTGVIPVIRDVDEEVENFKAALQESDVDRFSELVLMDRRTNTVVSHRDVGIGISQVLPVLVAAYSYRNQLVAIEQPEIHLHPALQAELGDVFIESALGERRNTFLLETHSEHLILRILRRVRETAEGTLPVGATSVEPGDVAVLYVEPEGTASRIILLPITREGEFARPWPRGFFAERVQELL